MSSSKAFNCQQNTQPPVSLSSLFCFVATQPRLTLTCVTHESTLSLTLSHVSSCPQLATAAPHHKSTQASTSAPACNQCAVRIQPSSQTLAHQANVLSPCVTRHLYVCESSQKCLTQLQCEPAMQAGSSQLPTPGVLAAKPKQRAHALPQHRTHIRTLVC